MNSLARARAYLAKLPPAIAGQGGHAATFVAACRLVEFGLTQSDALAVLNEWNGTHCQPPWTERDLRHKLADACRRTVPREHFISPGGSVRQPGKFPRDNTAPPSSKRARANPSAFFFSDAASQPHFSTLATLRGLSAEGLRLAYKRGLLRFGLYRDRRAWFILDRSHRVTQARRLNGQTWFGDVKALTLPGSQAAWPIGIREARDFPAVALCEGGPDLLAACAFILAEGRERDIAPVAMLGGCAAIHPDALPLFNGKRVRIFPHVDETGDNAANRWAEQLDDAGATVDAFSLAGLRRANGRPVKDLNDLAAIHADDFEAHRCLWELFNYASFT